MKVFVIPVPPTPRRSTTHPELSSQYIAPLALTENGSASGIQALSNGRLIFSRSSLTSPNDVFIIRGLKHLEDEIEAENKKLVVFKGHAEQITHFTEDALHDKNLCEGEEFWFKGANDKDVHGWALKPKGFKAGEKKQWPVVLLIHGGVRLHTSDISGVMFSFNFPASRSLGRPMVHTLESQWCESWLGLSVADQLMALALFSLVFAQQGYFVLALNPTGSTTFGQR